MPTVRAARSRPRRGRIAALAGLLSAAIPSGCGPKAVVRTLPDQSPPFRAANSFVHCVEGTKSLCIQSDQAAAGWDAFFLLTWLSAGSPLSIMASLSNQLQSHNDAREIERRFVDEVERYADALRGAECEATAQTALVGLIDRVSLDAGQRLVGLGLWQRGMDTVVVRLTEEAHRDLDGGYLVRMECSAEPFRLWVGVTEREGLQQVVGMSTLVPENIGGIRPPRDEVQARLAARGLGLTTASGMVAENTIGPWLPFPVEEF